MKDSWKQVCLWAGLILAITVITYLPALRDGFVSDDQANIVGNQLLRTSEGLKKTWTDPSAQLQYYPLTYTGFWIEYHLWGLDAFGYHLVNVLLHALNAILFGMVLTRLSVPGAWLAALIYAVHPIHVESIVYISELKNVLSGFFYLVALLVYLRFLHSTHHRWRLYLLAFLLFVCALLSKTSVVSLPFAILLLQWWKQERVKKQDVLLLMPLLFAAAVLGLLTAWVERHYVGAEGPEWRLTLVERCLVAGRVVWFYAGKLVWPHPLMFIYPRWQVDPAAAWQYVFPVATGLVIAALWVLRNRLGKAPLVGVLFFVGTSAPLPAFINVLFMRYSYVSDHFQYLPCMGLIALAAAGIWSGLRRDAQRAAAAGLLILGLGMGSWQHCDAFYSEETLWRDTIAGNPDCSMAQNNLGAILFDRGEAAEAVSHFEQALRVKPDYAEAYNNLGTAMVREGRIPEAVADYEQALRLKPGYANALFNLGNALAQEGKIDEAIADYEQSLQIYPYSAEAHYNLGNALVAIGKLDEAVAHYEQALSLKPDYAEAQNNLGRTLMQQGKLMEATAHFEEALRLKPDYAEAHNNLGFALVQLNRLDEAIAHFQQAVQLKPDFAEAHFTLGFALLQEGKTAEAIAHFQQALRLKPDFADARRYLNLALARQSGVAPGR